MSDVNAARRKSLVDANTNEEEIIMPGHMGKTAKPTPKRRKPNGKNGLTAKQKTLPKFLQNKIKKANKKTKHPGRR